MKRQISIALLAISTLTILALPVIAATQVVSDRENNDTKNLSAGAIASGEQVEFQGRISGTDRSDLYSLLVKGGGRISFVVKKTNSTSANSQTRLRVWTDRDSDGRITNEARLLDLESFQERAATLTPGLYVVQITQSQTVPDVHNYIAEAKAQF
jgi:hypothetical protein